MKLRTQTQTAMLSYAVRSCGARFFDRTRPWTSPSQLASLLPKVIGEELGIDQYDLEKSFALKALGGNESNGSVYFNFWSSGPAADKWQVLSPIKGEAAGTLILNRLHGTERRLICGSR
jgi:hypothetical protein